MRPLHFRLGRARRFHFHFPSILDHREFGREFRRAPKRIEHDLSEVYLQFGGELFLSS